MRNLCPTCRRRFDEAGFCPFDRSPLTPIAAPDQATQRSGPIARLDVPAVPHAPAYPGDDLPTVTAPAGADAEDPDAAPAPEVPPAAALPPGRRTVPRPPPPPGAARHGGESARHAELFAARTRPGRPASRPPRVRAASDPPQLVSHAAEDRPDAALAQLLGAHDSEYDKLVGQTLDGRYCVENKIGEGGMGVVFAARHAVIERPLAIKVLKREAMRDAGTILRFVQEAKAASRIGHPNIVDVTDFGTTPDGMTYSVMEFVQGQTLGTAIRRGAPFPALRAIRITAQIARALGAAHDKGIVHRDLKPENVFLLDRDGREDCVKIVDFGIAKVSPPPGEAAGPRLTRVGSVFGTPEYMAPEQAAGRGDTDGRVDIYALGVIFYEMICGRVPHRGDSMVRTLAMQMLDPIEPPSKLRPDLAISPELEAVVMRALAKPREHRYAAMGELLDALDQVLPPMVGHSITGSPIYTLAALPPGADPGVVPAVPAMPLAAPPTAPPRAPDRAGEPGPGHRVKDEPQFTADDRPVSFEHVFTEELVQPRDQRWPRVLGLALVVGAAAGALGTVIQRRAAGGHRATSALAAPPDAGPHDAPAAPPDAALVADAAEILVVAERDAPHRSHAPHPDDAVAAAVAVAAETPNHRGTIAVQVLTRPDGAKLYDDGGHYRGPGGAQLEEAYGTRITVRCRQAGYRPGSVEVRFDGATSAVLCVLERIKLCINNLKNPFDDCELAPEAAPGSPPQAAPDPPDPPGRRSAPDAEP